MDVISTLIDDVKILKPKVFHDDRGYFAETFREEWFKANVCDIDFVQDNESRSSFGVIRGLHFQKPPYSQDKLVRCTRGRVLDVAVDLRKSSKTYGQTVAVELSDENHLQFFIPKGFAHGFAVLSEVAVFEYKCSDYYHPESEGGISIFSPELNIDWLIQTESRILSAKDTLHPSLKDFETPFE